MCRSYIHERDDWPKFYWQDDVLPASLAQVWHRQGCLIGRMEALGFQLREEAVLHTLTEDVIKSSDIVSMAAASEPSIGRSVIPQIVFGEGGAV